MATNTASSSPEPRLSVCRRLLFGLAGPPLQLTQNAIGLYLNLFLLETARLRPILISAIMFSGRFVDAISDPLIGYGVARTRTRLGKCRPWLLAAAPLSAMTFFVLWLPLKDNWGDLGRLMYFLPAYVAFSLAISCYHIPYTTLTIRVSALPRDRDSATAFRMAFEMLGILIGPLFFTFIVEPKRTSVTCWDATLELRNSTLQVYEPGAANATQGGKADEQAAYLMSAGAVSTLVFLCGIAGFLGVRELPDDAESHDAEGHNDEAAEAVIEQRGKSSICTYLRQCKQVVTYGPFLQAIVIFITLSLSWHIFQAISILYVTHVMRIPGHVRFCTLTYLLVALAATPAWHFFATRFGKKLALQIGSVGTAACCLLAGLMPGGIVPLVYSMVTAAGILGANALLLTWATLPDVIQSFYRDNGARLEAVFYSTFTFFNKCAVSLSLAGLNLALDLAGYDRFACVQPDGLVTGLRGLLLAPLPLLCLAVRCSWQLPSPPAGIVESAATAAAAAADAHEVGEIEVKVTDGRIDSEDAGCDEKFRV